MTYKAWLFAIALLLLGAHASFAQGIEVFSASFTGISSCADFSGIKVKQTIFVAFDANEIVFATDIGFNNIIADATIFDAHAASSTSIVFGAYEDDPGIIGVAVGTAKLSSLGSVVSFSGTVNALTNDGCIIGGTVKSGKRLL